MNFFVQSLSFVFCFVMFVGMYVLQAPESRLIAELLDGKIEPINGLKPASPPISVFWKVVFIVCSLCSSLSPKTKISDFQFFPDSEEDKSEYVDVHCYTEPDNTDSLDQKMEAIRTILFQQRIPQCLLIMLQTACVELAAVSTWLTCRGHFYPSDSKQYLLDLQFNVVHCGWWLVDRVKRQDWKAECWHHELPRFI